VYTILRARKHGWRGVAAQVVGYHFRIFEGFCAKFSVLARLGSEMCSSRGEKALLTRAALPKSRLDTEANRNDSPRITLENQT